MKLEDKIIDLMDKIQTYRQTNVINIYDQSTLYNYYNDLKKMIELNSVDYSTYNLIKRNFKDFTSELEFLQNKGMYTL